MPAGDGGLGSSLVGEKVTVGPKNLQVTKLIGEGGFSYVYLVKEMSEGLSSSTHVDLNKVGKGDEHPARRPSGSGPNKDDKKVPLVLKVTSIHSRSQRDIAEKEAKLLSRLSHPSIVKMYDTCYRTVGSSSQGKGKGTTPKERPQHFILMEFCEGGHALDVCNKLVSNDQRFDLPTLIIAFGQICNAVSYLHAQRPPIVHRDLKPVNFLVKNGAYKLCDFGSAVFGHVDLRTSKARADAEEVIQKTTTQMFRAPEMVDLFMTKKLTQATDVWALGGCLYSLAFLQNCFEEGSNLAILSGKYTIPEDNPYGEGLVKLLERMLTSDCKARADMTEVILCLSAVYSGRPLPPRKKSSRTLKNEGEEGAEGGKKDESLGNYRTDGQGIQQPVYDPTKATEGKKLASNSVAARRKRAAATASTVPPTGPSTATPTTSAPTPAPAPAAGTAAAPDPLDFTNFGSEGKDAGDDFVTEAGFGEMKGFESKADGKEDDFFGSFDKVVASSGPGSNDGFVGAFDGGAWGDSGPPTESNAEASPELQTDLQETPDGATKNESVGDSERKERSSRRRRQGGGGGSRSSRTGTGGVEAGVEAINISEGGDGSRDRRSRASKPDESEKSRQSGSRGRRKGRPNRGDREGLNEDLGAAPSEKDRKTPDEGSSFKKMFGRNKSPPADP